MTRPSKSDLVLDGNTIKLRLKAERQHTRSLVHVDWVRFTCRLKNSPLPTADDLFPRPGATWETSMLERMAKTLRDLPDPDFSTSVQAKTLADQVCEALGPDFLVYPEVRKGHDFYRFRWSIVRNDVECGWVGYLSSGESPRQQAQASTIHCNVYGTACTFALPGFNFRLAQLILDTQATITRVDLALDCFDGISGGMERVANDYAIGAMDVYGKRPKASTVGCWPMNRERSFYVGSKEGGKQTNVYEKGHQLFKADDPWVRCELRYGNKARVLDAEMLTRPDDFFAGASDWHFNLLREIEAEAQLLEKMAVPASAPTARKLAKQTILAEVTRNVRWLRDTAAPSLALAFQYLGSEAFMQLVEFQKLPGRLQKFTTGEVVAAYQSAFKKSSGSGFGRLGLQPYSA